MVRRPADPCRIDPFKADIAQIQCLNKHIDRANRIVLVDPILKAFWQQRRLPAIQPRHEARHQIPRRTSKGIIAWEEVSHSLDPERKSEIYCWWKSPNVATRAPRPTSATRLRRQMHNKLRAAARCIRATLFGKIDDLQFPPLRVHILIPKISGVACLAVQHGSGGAFGGYGIMNPRRFPTVAAPLCGTVVLAGWVVAWLAGFGSAGIENTGAVPIEDRRAPSLPADAHLADAPQATAMGNAAVANADVATAAESVTGTATDTTAVSDEPESIVEAASPDSSQMQPPEAPPMP